MLQAEVSSDEAEALTRQFGLRFYRTCVKDNLNVSEGNHHMKVVSVVQLLASNAMPCNDISSCYSGICAGAAKPVYMPCLLYTEPSRDAPSEMCIVM